MKIKLDENIPAGLCPELEKSGHDVQTVPSQGLAGRDDRTVWEACQQESRFLITQDLDFSNVQVFPPGSHYGILLLRLKRPGRRALRDRILNLFRMEAVDEWEGCFVVASERKLRIRKPT